MTKLVWNVSCLLCTFAVVPLLTGSDCFALDPKFAIDPSSLGSTSRTTEKVKTPQKKAPVLRPVPQRKPVLARKRSTPVPRRTAAEKRRQLSVGSGFQRHSVPGADSAVLTQTLRMSAPVVDSAVGLQLARDVWERLLPNEVSGRGALNIGDENFSLALDPARYPVFPAADGGKIVIDAGMSLSPLVKTILQEKDPGIRFVTAAPGGGPRFFSPLLAAARFYSVEENVFLQFGVDPQLSVNADFKIEKSPDSLLRNEIVLLNTTAQRAGLPQPLVSFLATEGFQVVEFTPPLSRVPDGSKVLYSITTDSPQGMVDAIFAALSLRCERDRQVVLDDGADSGVMLTVRAQRYHEGNGQKTVISFFEGNPVQYTLLRLLALKGYQVVVVGSADDFKTTAAKVLAALDIPAHYGMQSLGTPQEAPFAVQLSGVSVHGRGRNGSWKVLTGRSIDPLVRDLVMAMGFDVVVQ